MSQSIFSVVDNVLSVIEKGNQNPSYGVIAQRVASALDSFFRGGFSSSSENDTFILYNYRLSLKDLLLKWNSAHQKKKVESTIRGQISILSSYFFRLFGTSATELYSAFSLEGDLLLRIESIISAYAVGQIDLTSYLPQLSSVVSDSFNSYSIEDCSEEMLFLRSFEKGYIDNRLSSLNLDKLSFVYSVLSKPLIVDSYVFVDGLKKKVRVPVLNETKLAFCSDFILKQPSITVPDVTIINTNLPRMGVTEASVSPVSSETSIVENSLSPGGIKDEESGSENIVIESEIGVSGNKADKVHEGVVTSITDTSISSSDTTDLITDINDISRGSDILDALSSTCIGILLEGMKAYEGATEKQKAKYISQASPKSLDNARIFLRRYTEQGFREGLNTLNYESLYQACKELNLL